MFTAQGSRMPKEANFATKVQKICEMCKFLFGVWCFVARYYGGGMVKVA